MAANVLKFKIQFIKMKLLPLNKQMHLSLDNSFANKMQAVCPTIPAKYTLIGVLGSF
jgi:hypothetical protein